MSILSTNKKLINIGKDYSAGSGIDITNEVISVTGNTVPYSAGENIDIQDFVISGKDWSNDITDASANAFNETTAWVHDNYTNSADVSFLSAEVDKKLDSSAWEAVSGSLATEDYVILSDNLTYARATAFATSQGYAKESACNSAFDYLNENKLDSSAFDLPNSGHWNEATNVVEGNSAAWFDNVGDVEVNNWVYNNSASTEDTTNVVETNSGSWNTVTDKLDATAFTNWQDGQYATDLQTIEGQISNKLDTSSFSDVSASFLTAINIPESATWNEVSQAYEQASGTYLTSHQSLDGYATEDWVTAQGYITGVDLSEYAKTSSVLDYIDSACSSKLDTTSFSNVSGDFLTTSFGISESAHWEEATNAYEQASGTYLTSHQDLSDYQTITGMTAYQPVGDYYSASNPSGFITGVDLTPYYTTADANTLSSMLSGAIDYVSANAGDEFPASANEAITAYQNASGTYLTAISIPESATWNDVSTTVQTNSATWGQGGGGGSYVSPSGSIWISSNNIESTDSAYIPSHPEDVLLTAVTSWSSMNGYATLANTNKVYFIAQAERASAFDNEGTFLNSSFNSTVLAETEYPPIKLYTKNWVSVKFSAYSAGIMDAYIVELARKNDVNSALNTKLDSSAFTGYYPSNNPSGFAKASDAVMTSSLNLFNGRIVGVNHEYLMGCDSACYYNLVGTSASTGTKTASAYVGTGHQGVDIQISAKYNGHLWVNWTAFGENGSDLSAGQLSWFVSTANKTSALNFVSPLAENISGVKLFGNNTNSTAYSAYTIDVKQLASQDNITFLSGAVDYVSANAGGEFPVSADEAIQYVQTNSGTIDDTVTSYQTSSGTFLTAHQAISAEEWNEVSTTVQTNSASWNDVSSKQDNLTFGYDGQDKISAINNSAIAGVGSLDIFPISGTGGVNVYEQTNVLWISGKDFTSDISYISGTIGDVETLLASL